MIDTLTRHKPFRVRRAIPLALLGALLLPTACSDEGPTDPDPEPDPDSGLEGPRVSANVVLPAGATYSVGDLSIVSGLDLVDVEENGTAEVLHEDGSAHLVWAIDTNDNIVMAGFIDDDERTISAETTALALSFLAMRANLQPFEVQEAVRDAIPMAPDYDLVRADVEAAVAAGGDVVAAVATNVGAWAEARFDEIQVVGPDRRAGVSIYPNGLLNGFQVSDVDLERFSITNRERRRGLAYVYPLRVTKEGGQEQVINTSISGSIAPLSETRVSPTTAIRGFTGVLTDWSKGGGLSFAATTTAPIEAPLAADEIEAVHAVRIISPGSIENESLLTAAEQAALQRLNMETLAIDWVLPLILDIAGHAQLFAAAGGTFPTEALGDFAERFGPWLSAAVPVAESKANAGDFQGAFDDFAFALWSEGGGALFGTLFDDLLVPLLNSVGATTTALPRRSTKVLEAIDVLMKVTDYLRLFSSTVGPSLTEFEVVARLEDVGLEPRRAESVPFVMQRFKALPRNTIPDGAVLAFDWTLSGGIGSLVDGTRRGTTLTTSGDEITWDPDLLVSGPTGGTLTVDISYTILSGASVELGSAEAELQLSPNEQRMRPVLPRLQCRSDVRLHLERTDGVVNLIDNPSWDWRVDWSTPGEFGHFEGGATSVTYYDRPDIVYSCTETDREVIDEIESVRATVWRSEPGLGQWVFVDVVEGGVRVDNDPNKIIRHYPIEVIEREIPQDNPAFEGWSALVIARIPPPKGPPNPLSYEVRTYGFTGAPSWTIQNGSWAEGAPSPRPLPSQLMEPGEVLFEGQYIWMVTASGCQGAVGGESCNAAWAADVGATLRAWGGWIEVVIRLEPDPPG
ncbi:MAG: hypothetical protein AAF389_05150 [Gemmatimonadota bacterium]